MLTDELDYVIGVDTHRDEHVLVVVAAPSGAVVARQAVRANARGYRDAVRFAELYASSVRAWAIEGTGSYGAGLARLLADRGETVLELSRTPRAERRLRGKDDSLDAARTARAALASETLALPRSGHQRSVSIAHTAPRKKRRSAEAFQGGQVTLARRGLVQAYSSSNEARESLRIDFIVLVEVDCAPGVAFEA